MKAEHADNFKFAVDFQDKHIHIVFEQLIPVIKRNPDDGEIITPIRNEYVEVAAVRLNYFRAMELAELVSDFINELRQQDNGEQK